MDHDSSLNAAGRAVGALLLLGAGLLSLPVAAALLDGADTAAIIPAQLIGMAVLGALLFLLRPRLLPAPGSAVRRAALGAVCGVAAGGVGLLVFALLLNGFSGA